ncbi:MAG: 2-polyprenylphenol 6-hydroxylase, partial [Alphaproteobacteria bacterium]|nr:2-polyprenylphenol 6-hydroxylase [Alphaproteobacteria bacterium]
MLLALRHLRRLIQIARTLARHDALFPLKLLDYSPLMGRGIRLLVAFNRNRDLADKPPGERLAAALQDLGPSFIKLGQALATRPDIVGEEVAQDLTRLQDRLP